MNTDFTYCAISHLCPRRNECKRHIPKSKVKKWMWWTDPEHNTEEEFKNCEIFVAKLE